MTLDRHQFDTDASRVLSGDRCHVFHFGLTHREVLILESLFRLHADLQRHYSFAVPTGAAPGAVLFVDGDSPQATADWRAFRDAHPAAAAVMVCERPGADADTLYLTRPLSFRNLDEIRYALRAATPRDALPPEDDTGLHVLVVDDSATSRELMQIRLEEAAGGSSLPLHIDFAETGESALEKARGRRYDLVFLDVVMPGIDGYEVCRRLKQAGKPRVAMISSRHAAVDYDRGHLAGCDHYLVKPAPATMINTVVRLTAMKMATPIHH